MRLSLVSVLLSGSLMAAPSPIDDEEFLLFLADSIEQDGEWIDPLSMIDEDTNTQTNDNQDNPMQKEADDE
ncbi:MAG: hypothetical protein ACI8SR_002380 [Oceanicoccus sp.]|jgi:hypothetical protein